jgi:sulfate permease, SulP family
MRRKLLGERRPFLLSSVRGYQRSWVSGDLVAGVTLLTIAVPEQLATSRLAGMPPITGFYAFIAGSLVFALLGSNPHVSVGADSTIAPLFAVGVAHFAASGSPRYVELVGVLAVLVGVIVALVWLLRLGWIAEFLSAPIITGFLAGVAVVIVVHQLPDLLGLPPTGGSTVHRIRFILGHLDDINGWTLLIGLGVLAIVVASERFDRRIPGALLGLVASLIAVQAFDLHSAHGVAVLGPVAHGPPHFGLNGLSTSAIRNLAPLAGVVALVVVTQSAATSRAFADRRGSEDVGRDLLGVGAGSIVAGLAGAFPVDASPPRTAAVVAASGRTQAGAIGAAAAMIALIPAVGALKNLPLATLAAVLIYVATRIFRGRDLVAIARFNALEFGLALITLLTVALVGVEQGIGVAVGLAILDRTRLSARPQLHVLGRLPGTTSWVRAAMAPRAHLEQAPGVLVVLFAASLWYANAVRFQHEVRAALAATSGTKVLVLDAIGMNDIDYTGARALREVLDDLDQAQIAFALARPGKHVREALARSGLLERIGTERLFPSVDEAVSAVAPEAGSNGRP